MSDEGRPLAGSEGKGRIGGRTPRFWVVSGLAVLGAVLFFQNSSTTNVHVLFWTVNMPLVFLLLVMVGLGIGIDRLWVWRQRRR